MKATVELLSTGSELPIEIATVDAKTCYEAERVELGERMNVEAALWNSGHHTTLMAPGDYVFRIEGVSVSTITLGLHLAFPFYNTGQRSGRFCSEMFDTMDASSLVAKLTAYRYDGGKLDPKLLSWIADYLEFGIGVFKEKREEATRLVRRIIREDRPNAPANYADNNAKKIAQEQLRVFIPTIVPTALIYKVNLVGLAALYRTAHLPELQDIVDQMVFLICQYDPRVSFMFTGRKFQNITPEIGPKLRGRGQIRTSPQATLKQFDRWPKGCPVPTQADLHPVDLLHADPRFMPLATRNIVSEVKLSLMTMGQDQRHRTIARGMPVFTADFYNPPVCELLGLRSRAEMLLEKWLRIAECVPPEVTAMIAPYGAMVSYEKSGDYRAIIHEQNKRTCWCAQAEIFELSRQLREQIQAKNPSNPITGIMAPRCYGRDMKCGEGKRYCGRDISVQEFSELEYFGSRRI